MKGASGYKRERLAGGEGGDPGIAGGPGGTAGRLVITSSSCSRPAGPGATASTTLEPNSAWPQARGAVSRARHELRPESRRPDAGRRVQVRIAAPECDRAAHRGVPVAA